MKRSRATIHVQSTQRRTFGFAAGRLLPVFLLSGFVSMTDTAGPAGRRLLLDVPLEPALVLEEKRLFLPVPVRVPEVPAAPLGGTSELLSPSLNVLELMHPPMVLVPNCYNSSNVLKEAGITSVMYCVVIQHEYSSCFLGSFLIISLQV